MAAQLSRFGTGLLRLALGGNDLKEWEGVKSHDGSMGRWYIYLLIYH